MVLYKKKSQTCRKLAIIIGEDCEIISTGLNHLASALDFMVPSILKLTLVSVVCEH